MPDFKLENAVANSLLVVVPVEVKAGAVGHLKSLHLLLGKLHVIALNTNTPPHELFLLFNINYRLQSTKR
jgi:hypothetical protein